MRVFFHGQLGARSLLGQVVVLLFLHSYMFPMLVGHHAMSNGGYQFLWLNFGMGYSWEVSWVSLSMRYYFTYHKFLTTLVGVISTHFR
jgi:hypothetical protein